MTQILRKVLVTFGISDLAKILLESKMAAIALIGHFTTGYAGRITMIGKLI
jgi:hypothetical protein